MLYLIDLFYNKIFR